MSRNRSATMMNESAAKLSNIRTRLNDNKLIYIMIKDRFLSTKLCKKIVWESRNEKKNS